jgi:hypothetical protein
MAVAMLVHHNLLRLLENEAVMAAPLLRLVERNYLDQEYSETVLDLDLVEEMAADLQVVDDRHLHHMDRMVDSA